MCQTHCNDISMTKKNYHLQKMCNEIVALQWVSVNNQFGALADLLTK